MAPHLSKDLRDIIVRWRSDHGYTYQQLEDLAGCSIGTIANILTYHNHYSTLVNPFRYYPGCPRLLDKQDRVYIYSLLQSEPTIYLDEIQVKLSLRSVLIPRASKILGFSHAQCLLNTI
ncbi:hypothetical protein BYT27DRAFT_7205724 [Phlegmacium glaucopus]|nr:hypothetical protein BYT27DRAFT_7205724 [Phlegmacium glaucopus]